MALPCLIVVRMWLRMVFLHGSYSTFKVYLCAVMHSELVMTIANTILHDINIPIYSCTEN
jgi:hypothetical protein